MTALSLSDTERDALLRLLDREIRRSDDGRQKLVAKAGPRANTTKLDEWLDTLRPIQQRLTGPERTAMAEAKIRVTIDEKPEDTDLYVRLEFPDSAWDETGDITPYSRLTLNKNVLINGCVLRVEARAVWFTEDNVMYAVEWPEDLDSVYSISTADGPLATTQIKGRDYIVIAFPVS